MSGDAWTITTCGGICPTQAEGITPWGTPFYFRARHGAWQLYDSPTLQGAHAAVEWCGGTDERWLADGDDPSHGFMERHEVEAILATVSAP
jgi:hypothetical protein